MSYLGADVPDVLERCACLGGVSLAADWVSRVRFSIRCACLDFWFGDWLDVGAVCLYWRGGEAGLGVVYLWGLGGVL